MRRILLVILFLFSGCEPLFAAPDIAKETPTIREAAKRNDCAGDDLTLLFAIRMAENGRPGYEFGVLCRRAAGTCLDTQAGWAAATIVKTRRRWIEAGCPGVFLVFLAERYCPSQTDPQGHINWKRNVRFYFLKFSKKGA